VIASGVHDLWTIFRLQKQAVRLDLKSALLRPASPFYHATARSLPGFGLWSGRVLTVVLREPDREGFVQARWRTGAPALDLLFIAPSLDARQGAAWVWQHLLHELGRVGGSQGVQRLFVHLPEKRHAEVEVMRQAGFAIYGQDRLYRLNRLPEALPAADISWVSREPVDDWGLTRLYHALTPAVVQQAESLMQGGSSGYAGWWGGSRQGSYVLRGESAGEVLGYLRLTRGEYAHWLKLVLHPERAQQGSSLLLQGLRLMAEWAPRPIYCDVRDYEGFLTDALEQCGFERVMTRMLLVRHTTASVRVKSPRTLKALEPAPETAPTPF
jgi:hypothetical protein